VAEKIETRRNKDADADADTGTGTDSGTGEDNGRMRHATTNMHINIL
jgi:hypothetical protein